MDGVASVFREEERKCRFVVWVWRFQPTFLECSCCRRAYVKTEKKILMVFGGILKEEKEFDGWVGKGCIF